MEWIWIVLLGVILIGPIILTLIWGRKAGAPREDALGSTGYGAVLKDKADMESMGGKH